MMNGEGPSVPITTLGGIQSLTDLLLELPLPTPLPGVTGHQSLLSHLRDSDEARRLLNTQESILIPSLIDALGRTTTDHIEVKDGYYGGGSHGGQMSQLVQFLLGRNPGLFKGSSHGPQSGSVSSGQWLQRQCSNIPVHPQQHVFDTPAVSPACQTQANSSGYYPLDHPPTPQGARVVQNKTVSVPPKSPSAYSPYAHAVATPGPQHPATPLHHNAISQGASDPVTSGLPENTQIFNSSLVGQHIVDVSQPSPATHPFSNGNCVNEVDLTAASARQIDRTENHIQNTAQVISNVGPNCSPIVSLVNNPNDVSMFSPSSSSSSTPQHVSSSSVIVGPSAPHVNCMKRPAVEQWQSVPNNSFENSQSNISAKENVNSMHNSLPEPTVQPIVVTPVSEPSTQNAVVNQSESKNKSLNPPKPDAIPEKKRSSVAEPTVVTVTKAVVENQVVEKNVKQPEVKDKSESAANAPTIPDRRRKSVTEPVVVLSRLSLEEKMPKKEYC